MKPDLEEFLRPLDIDVTTAHKLSHELCRTFEQLSSGSLEQFLPTPISESILRPAAGREKGRGGTNLRAGFIELLGNDIDVNTNGHNADLDTNASLASSNIRRLLEKSWPILEVLKNENADSLFAWIGKCIAEVVREGCETFGLPRDVEIPMGVTFSFPMKQNTLSEATLMAMGKGFTITSNLDLNTHLMNGYEESKSDDLPPIKISAILNDAVATLASFIYQAKEDTTHKAAMGLICGTGCNATIPLRKSTLHPDKLPGKVKTLAGNPIDDVRVAVNTEWSINGSAGPLRDFGLISKWDEELNSEVEVPGFQPLEYMTAGRYLGELGRLMLVDYLKTHLNYSEDILPSRLLDRFGLTTTFLSHFRPLDTSLLLQKLEAEFPSTTSKAPFQWTEEIANALYHIAKSIEVRAAAMIAASIIGLLACAGDIPLRSHLADRTNEQKLTNGALVKTELIVGYTGGCIVHFQDYLSDCQKFLDSIIEAEFGESAPVRIVLSPCHDGGITGAGVLCGASQGPYTDSPVTIVVSDADATDRKEEDDDDNDSLDTEQRLRLRASTSSPPGLAPDGLDEHLFNGRAPSRSRSRSALRRAKTNGHGAPHSTPIDKTAPEETETLLSPSSSSSTVEDEEEDSDRSSSLSAAASEEEEEDDDGPTYLIDTDKRRFWIVFLGIMLTYFIACFDSTIMASSHPAITSHFQSSNRASWLSTAFLLTSTAFQPLVGRVSDALGRKRPYLVTMSILALATLWCALAQSMTSFILARAVCGIGAGGSMTLGSITISDLVPIERRGTYQSYINLVYGLAAASGAAFGGLMADTLGWRWEFGIQVFPIVLSLSIAAVGIPRDIGLRGKRADASLRKAIREFDWAGSALLTTSTTFLILGLNLGGNVLPWSHPFIITSLAIFSLAFSTCLWVESRVARPIMPLVLLHSAPRANIIFANFIASFLMNAILFNVPLFFQAVLLTSATTSGLYLTIPTATASATGILTGLLISRTKRLKWALQLGTCGYLVGSVALCALGRGWPTWAYLACLVPAAAGQGFQFPGTFLAVLSASAQRDQAVVTSTLALWRALGNVLGVAASSLALQNALLAYLRAFVRLRPEDGRDEAWKAALIERVRASVAAVADMPPGEARAQVVQSYNAAVRVTFLMCVGFAAVNVLLILPIRLPRLGSGGTNRK
ncbi:MFS general substrate transporter [Camillea tinctor]|nr:MFS general substrate transporter [Camillea tinctor]